MTAISAADSNVDGDWTALLTLLGSAGWFRALSVEDRLESCAVDDVRELSSRPINEEPASARLRRWRAGGAYNDDPLFSDTTTLYGCSDEQLLAILCEPVETLQGRSQDPWWLEELRQAFLHATPGWELPREILPLEPDRSLLYLIAPLIESAATRLCARASCFRHSYPHAPFTSADVGLQFLPSICEFLLTLVRPSLVVELHAARLEGKLRGPTPTDRFSDFVGALRRPLRSLEILHRYPVLARLAVTILDAWCTASAEFLERLAQDWIRLGRTFGGWDRTGALQSVKPLGDRHRYGRRVLLATFDSGFEIVYKPRPLVVDKHFQELLSWFNRNTSVVNFRSLSILDRGEYGWEETVHATPCDSREDAARFYRRQGAYLALLRVLGAVDIHYENVIAAGDQPVLVDLEPLFHRVAPPLLAQLEGAERLAAEITSRSVMYVGMLPQRLLAGADSEGIDFSGLAAESGSLMPVRAAGWRDAGTDEMRQFLRRLAIGNSGHTPFAADAPLALIDFLDDLLEGFGEMWGALVATRDRLLDPDGPLVEFERDETRCLLRPTLAYALLLVSSFHPHFLSDALDLDRRFDRLLANSNVCRSRSSVIRAEREALWQGDIPAFSTTTDSTHIWASRSCPVDDFLPDTGLEFVRRRLHQLNDSDLGRERWAIKMAVATSGFGSDAPMPARMYALPSDKLSSGTRRDRATAPTHDVLLEMVDRIAARLVGLAIQTRDDATWIGVRSISGTKWSVDQVGPDLYDGCGGIALFLGYAGETLRRAAYTEVAQRAVVTMKRQLDRRAQQDDLPLGAFSGTAGHIYSLMLLAGLWNDEKLLQYANELAVAIPRRLGQDRRFDVAAGAAGAIPVLLQLYRTGADFALEVATLCGNHLVASSSAFGAGRGWVRDEISDRPLAGFAHGAAGIAWALLELAAETADQRFVETATAALRYERSLFSSAARNWRDVRKHAGELRVAEPLGEEVFMHFWCHGSAGIGLARLRSMAHWRDEFVEDELRAAAQATLRGFGLNHSLCHGDLGNLELFCELDEKMPELSCGPSPELLLTKILESMERRGWVSGHPLGLESPDLMLGLAGIGYGLLRRAKPLRVPCVLLLDAPTSGA